MVRGRFEAAVADAWQTDLDWYHNLGDLIYGLRDDFACDLAPVQDRQMRSRRIARFDRAVALSFFEIGFRMTAFDALCHWYRGFHFETQEVGLTGKFEGR